MKWLRIFPIILVLFSCDWSLERVEIQDQIKHRAINLAVGDTSSLVIEGQGFSEAVLADTSIVEVIYSLLSQGVEYSFVAKQAGQTLLALAYDETGSDSYSVLEYIQLVVSDGISLDVYSREDHSINYRDYVSVGDFDRIDSVATLVTGDVGDELWFPVGGASNEALNFMGNRPGETTLLISFFDRESVLITTLLFECHVSIRKITLAEFFTNSGCVNCPEANHYMDNIFGDRSEDMALIRYHVSWTDPNDPMNNYNPTEVRERVIFYGVYLAPSFVLDGTTIGTLDETDWISRVDAATSLPADVYVSPIEVIESTDSLLYLDFELESFGADLGTLDVWSLVLEDSITYAGTNGEILHMQVMRDMTSSSVSGLLEDTAVSHDLTAPYAELRGTSRTIVVYVQDPATKRVLQARRQILD